MLTPPYKIGDFGLCGLQNVLYAMYQVGFLGVLDLLLKHMTSFSVYSSSYTIHH